MAADGSQLISVNLSLHCYVAKAFVVFCPPKSRDVAMGHYGWSCVNSEDALSRILIQRLQLLMNARAAFLPRMLLFLFSK